LTLVVFDRVRVVVSGIVRKTYSREQFLALPLHVRIEFILSRDIQFLLGETRVDRNEALKSLRA